MKASRRIDLYIGDMIQSMERIFLYLEGHSFESFQNNFMTVDAVARNFEINGEAAGQCPLKFRRSIPNCPGIKCTSFEILFPMLILKWIMKPFGG